MAQDHDGQASTRGAGQGKGQGRDVAQTPGADARRPLDAAARARIGRGLRLHYAAVLDLPVPERLRTLLDDLAAGADRESQR